MAKVWEIVLRNFFVFHNSFENTVKYICPTQIFYRLSNIKQFPRLFADGDFFIFDFAALAFGFFKENQEHGLLEMRLLARAYLETELRTTRRSS